MDWKQYLQLAWNEIVSFSKNVVKDRLSKEATWSLLGIMSELLFPMLSAVALAFLIGAESMGTVLLVMAITTLFTQFFDLHFSETITEHYRREATSGDKENIQKGFNYTILIEFLLSVACFALFRVIYKPLLSLLPYDDNLVNLLKIFSFAIPALLLKDSVKGPQNILGDGKNRDLIRIICNGIIFAGYLISGFINPVAVIWASVITLTLTTIINLFISLKTIRNAVGKMTWKFRSPERGFLRDTIKAGSRESLVASGKLIPLILLGMLAPIESIAYFEIARRGSELLKLPLQTLHTSLKPGIDEAWSLDDPVKKRQIVRRYILFTGIICIVGISFFMSSAGWIVDFILPMDFRATANLMRWLAISTGISAIVSWPFLASKNAVESWLDIVLLSGVMIVRAALTALMASKLGAAGAAFADLLTSVGLFIVVITIIQPKLGVTNLFSFDDTTTQAGP